MTNNNPNKPYNVARTETARLPPQVAGAAFLITASELRERKTKRRRKQDDLPGHPETIRRLGEIGLRAKPK